MECRGISIWVPITVSAPHAVSPTEARCTVTIGRPEPDGWVEDEN